MISICTSKNVCIKSLDSIVYIYIPSTSLFRAVIPSLSISTTSYIKTISFVKYCIVYWPIKTSSAVIISVCISFIFSNGKPSPCSNFNTPEELKAANPNKVFNDLGGMRKKLKLEIAIPTKDEVMAWFINTYQ